MSIRIGVYFWAFDLAGDAEPPGEVAVLGFLSGTGQGDLGAGNSFLDLICFGARDACSSRGTLSISF
ncbi:MAG: hypothetical protein EOP06_23140 [Proteobacteria bacterium]|nr:MAG: hypothetical protein EOP06_23140 [Pseudomonadota bacterium]